jgi:hypothetical protein
MMVRLASDFGNHAYLLLGITMHRDSEIDVLIDAEIEAYKCDIDRTLLRENLKLTVEQRLLQLIEQARLADEFDRARDAQGRT